MIKSRRIALRLFLCILPIYQSTKISYNKKAKGEYYG